MNVQEQELNLKIRAFEKRTRELEAALRMAQAKIADQKQTLEQYSQGPFQVATVLAGPMSAPPSAGAPSLAPSAGKPDAPLAVSHVLVRLAGKDQLLAIVQPSPSPALEVGERVFVSANMLVVGRLGPQETGQVFAVSEVLDGGQLLVAGPAGSSLLLDPVPELASRVKAGESVLADPTLGLAYKLVEQGHVEQLLSPEVPNVEYDEIGGLGPQIEKIRDAVELPFLHPDLYKRYGLKPPKGILLYGPPGCGKTLIAKAVATSLGRDQLGRERAYFLSVKGPELLSRFVGESERQIRALFSRARELAATNRPVVIFFDEMESLFRMRGSGVSSDVETTVVPQLLAEIDGVEQLDNVILIGASNREDMLDPAVTRPGRLDVKIRIDRPDVQAAGEIFDIHLGQSTPLAPCVFPDRSEGSNMQATRGLLREHLQSRLGERSPRTALYQAVLADNSRVELYVADFLSGAMIASIVERAKKEAIKSHLLSPSALQGLSIENLDTAIDLEIQEMGQLRPSLDASQWAYLLGLDAALVSRVLPLRV